VRIGEDGADFEKYLVSQKLVRSETFSRLPDLHCLGGSAENSFAVGSVLDPGKGVCADPVGRDATLGAGGPGPPVGAGEHQLSPDRGGEKT
jgi:hypothetical protein